MSACIEYTWGMAGHLNGMKNGKELQQAYETTQPKVVKAFSEFSQLKPLFDALSNLESQMSVKLVQDFLKQQHHIEPLMQMNPC